MDFLKEQRNKMIFDDNLEMSERRDHDQNAQKDQKQAQQPLTATGRLNVDSVKE